MNKKAVILRYGDKPLAIMGVVDMPVMDFLTTKKEAEANLKALISERDSYREQIAIIKEELAEVKREIALLKGE